MLVFYSPASPYAGGLEDLWSAKATADGPQRPSWVAPSPEQRAAFEQLSRQVSAQMGPWLAALGLSPDEVLGNPEAIGGEQGHLMHTTW